MNENTGNGKPPPSPSRSEQVPKKKSLVKSMAAMVSSLSTSVSSWLYNSSDDKSREDSQSDNQSVPSTSRQEEGETSLNASEVTMDDLSNKTRKRVYDQISEDCRTSTSNSKIEDFLNTTRKRVYKHLIEECRTSTPNSKVDDASNGSRKRGYEQFSEGCNTSKPSSKSITSDNVNSPYPQWDVTSKTYPSVIMPSTSSIVDKTVSATNNSSTEPHFNKTLLLAPFYPGKTTYGGAASATYYVPTKRKRLLISKSKEDESVENIVSEATQRISKVLDSYSSPLEDAKILPSSITYQNRNRTNCCNMLNRQPNNMQTRNSKTLSGYKHKSLYVNNNARYLQRAKLLGSTSKARQILASLSSSMTEDFTISALERNEIKDSSKVSNDVQDTTSKKKDILVQVDLCTPIHSYSNRTPPLVEISPPKTSEFIFSAPTEVSEAWLRSLSQCTKSNHDDNIPKTSAASVSIETSPTVTELTKDASKPKLKAPKWRCDCCYVDNDVNLEKCICCEAKKPTTSLKETIKVTSKPETKISKWRCDCCLVENDISTEKCVCCEAKKPTASLDAPMIEVTSSESQIKPNIAETNNPITSVQEPIKNISKPQTHNTKWRCDCCFVENDMNANKCICCEAKIPAKYANFANQSEQIVSKPQTNTTKWRCDCCFVENDMNANKCICCEAKIPAKYAQFAKPSEQKSTNEIKSQPDNFFKEIVKSQSARWECNSCLTRNDSNKDKCICCESEKPGTEKQAAAITSFNFGTVPCSFKFGIPQNEIKSSSTTDQDEVIPEKNNNVITKLPKPIETKKDSDEKIKPTFSFGIPTTASVALPSYKNVLYKTPNEINVKVPDIQPTNKEQETKQPTPSLPPFIQIPSNTSEVNLPLVKPIENIVPNIQLPTETKPDISVNVNSELFTRPIQFPSTTSVVLPSPEFVAAPVKSASIAPVTNSLFGVEMTSQTETKPANPTFNFTFGWNKTSTADTNTQFKTTDTAAVVNNPINFNPISVLPTPSESSSNISVSNPQPLLNTFGQSSLLPNNMAATTSSFIITQPSLFGSAAPNIFSTNAQNAAGPSTTNIFGGVIQSTAPITTPTFTFGVSNNSGTNNTFGVTTKNTPFNASSQNPVMLFGSNNAPSTDANAAPFGNVQSNTNIFGSSNAQNTSAFLTFPSGNIGATTQQFPSQQPFNNNLQVHSSPFGSNNNAPQPDAKQLFGNMNSNTFALPTPPPQQQQQQQPAAPAFGFPTNSNVPMFGVVSPQPNAGNSNTGRFNFQLGQQSQQSTPGVYNFGASPSNPPQIQFNMGSFSTPPTGSYNANSQTTVRRYKKALRRTTNR